MKVTDEMVNRFLMWKLPDDFAPDAGISFKRVYNETSPYGPNNHEPTGTNLFNATQARAMLEHVIAAAAPVAEEPQALTDQETAVKFYADNPSAALFDFKNRMAEEPQALREADSVRHEGAVNLPEYGWYAMEQAPLDGTLVRLLVRFDNHGIEDSDEPSATIGSHNDGEWNFVGWEWYRDEWTRGSGDLLGWLPMLDRAVLAASPGAALSKPEAPQGTEATAQPAELVQRNEHWRGDRIIGAFLPDLRALTEKLIDSALDSDASGRPEGSLADYALELRHRLASLPEATAPALPVQGASADRTFFDAAVDSLARCKTAEEHDTAIRVVALASQLVDHFATVRACCVSALLNPSEWSKEARQLLAAEVGASLAESPQAPALTCDWSQDGDEYSDTWGTKCGHYFRLDDDKPTENGMLFCCYCGGKLIEHLIEPEPEEPDATPEARTQAPALSDAKIAEIYELHDHLRGKEHRHALARCFFKLGNLATPEARTQAPAPPSDGAAIEGDSKP